MISRWTIIQRENYSNLKDIFHNGRGSCEEGAGRSPERAVVVPTGQPLLDEARAKYPGVRSEPHLIDGAPGAAVLQVAAAVGVALVAVGRRGLAPAASLLMGSASADILHRSRVPVLVVHDAPPRTLETVLVGLDDFGSPGWGTALWLW